MSLLEELESVAIINESLFSRICEKHTSLKDKLDYVKVNLLRWLKESPELFDSIVINKAKPVTYRLTAEFELFGVLYTINLHKFLPCDKNDAFMHPHAYPICTEILEGEYELSGTIRDISWNGECCLVESGESYSMLNPEDVHKIVPLRDTYTIMIRGHRFEKPSENCKTVKGKGLKEIPEEEKKKLIDKFIELMEAK